ncbi:MAG TPA: metallophosphoesterase [Candidatus Brachybacterium merdavium]|uniref:Metallophosphoesterase n=1 Tax=Candidatus Brachybacterium merdavium TaxID=2838513 RepID=A0A9D2LAT1_9MICO|nr:metallophosphoesterase [Candidatus Brachybacterium merdavium]
MSSARRPDRTAPSPLPSGPPPTGSGDTSPTGSGIVRGRLSFPADGQLTIVQFNDTQDCHRTDVRTTQLQRAVLEDVDPDVVVLNGDVVDGAPSTPRELRQAINNVVQPMEERGIPWVLTLGNHDADSAAVTGLGAAEILEFAGRYPHNLNTAGAEGITGRGNQVLMITGSRSPGDAFALWLIDSGRYAPERIAGQDLEGYPRWDWVRADQVRWYLETSEAIEAQNAGPVPGLLFQHIPLWEHRFMWFASVDSRTPEDHARAVTRHGIRGLRHEEEATGPLNSGLFSALLHRGDVRGVYVGHDHVNTYDGDYYGVRLGYGPGTGFGTYGLSGRREHHLRGARVFHLDEQAEGVLTGTELRLACDYGIDLSPGRQPGPPAELPAWAR